VVTLTNYTEKNEVFEVLRVKQPIHCILRQMKLEYSSLHIQFLVTPY